VVEVLALLLATFPHIHLQFFHSASPGWHHQNLQRMLQQFHQWVMVAVD
jgi:hypothetical protein